MAVAVLDQLRDVDAHRDRRSSKPIEIGRLIPFRPRLRFSTSDASHDPERPTSSRFDQVRGNRGQEVGEVRWVSVIVPCDAQPRSERSPHPASSSREAWWRSPVHSVRAGRCTPDSRAACKSVDVEPHQLEIADLAVGPFQPAPQVLAIGPTQTSPPFGTVVAGDRCCETFRGQRTAPARLTRRFRCPTQVAESVHSSTRHSAATPRRPEIGTQRPPSRPGADDQLIHSRVDQVVGPLKSSIVRHLMAPPCTFSAAHFERRP